MTTKLESLARRYRQMPNGGAVLQVDERGNIGNGMAVVASYATKAAAVRALREYGWEPRGSGWKLVRT